MYSFILINQSNLKDILNINGIWQIGLIVLSFAIGLYIIRTVVRKLLVYKLNHPFRYAILDSVLRPAIFTAILIVLSSIYGIITHYDVILAFSLVIFMIAVMFINLTSFLISLPLLKQKKISGIRRKIRIFLWVGVIFWSANLDKWLANNLSTIYLNFGASEVSIWFLLKQLAFILLDMALMFWASMVVDGFINNAREMNATQKQLLTRISKVFIILIGTYIILPSMGINLTSLAIFGSALGVGLAFGLQKIASNFLSGFIILLDKSVCIGDRIVINGTTGDVTQITTRYTVMQAFDGSEVIIPNEQFITNTVINQTHTHNDIGVEVIVAVAYTSNLTLALETIQECITLVAEIRTDKSPLVSIKALGASGIDIFIRVWPKDPLNGGTTVKNKLIINILEKFRENGIEIALPKMDVMLNEQSSRGLAQ